MMVSTFFFVASALAKKTSRFGHIPEKISRSTILQANTFHVRIPISGIRLVGHIPLGATNHHDKTMGGNSYNHHGIYLRVLIIQIGEKNHYFIGGFEPRVCN